MNSYEKALQKIAQDSKCKPQCMGAIIGPTGPTGPAGMGITGPTGPQGPVSVTVGTTTTGAPGSQASVTNTGTVDDVVLAFTIPEGPTGPTGDIGATGPTGPANGLNAYGGLYHESTGNVSLNNTDSSTIPLDNEMPELNVTYTPTNTITIQQAGTYELIYGAEISSAQQTTVTLSVRNGTSNVDGTAIAKALNSNVVTSYNGNIITDLDEGDTLTLSLVALVSTEITLAGTGLNAQLAVKKLN